MFVRSRKNLHTCKLPLAGLRSPIIKYARGSHIGFAFSLYKPGTIMRALNAQVRCVHYLHIIPTNTYILNFNTPKPPTIIKIGYLITKVETYIPNPLRCHNCQKFGHHKEKCTRPSMCKNCGETGNHLDCQQPPKCANCKQNHSADSKECELWRKGKRILEIKPTQNISYLEARNFIENSLATTTYTNIVKLSCDIPWRR